jgi:hypothetical protein
VIPRAGRVVVDGGNGGAQHPSRHSSLRRMSKGAGGVSGARLIENLKIESPNVLVRVAILRLLH